MNTISQETMDMIYKEIMTPYKYGVILDGIPDEENVLLDCPCVFRHKDKWYMSFVSHNPWTETGGYRTHLASSEDLVNWTYERCIFDNSEEYPQCAAFPSLCDVNWEENMEIECLNGRIWWTTMEGETKGYEGEPMNIGMLSGENLEVQDNWIHSENLLLSVHDEDVREGERATMYRSTIIHDSDKVSGYEFVMYYNAKALGPWHEQIFMAVSDDLIHWTRMGKEPVLSIEKHSITGDPQIIRIGDMWVMNVFAYTGNSPAYNTFAVSGIIVADLLYSFF